jgi:hypothetical protein
LKPKTYACMMMIFHAYLFVVLGHPVICYNLILTDKIASSI